MIRYFLAKGDRAGSAIITEGLDNVTCSNPPPGVQIATLYMRTYCAACKQEGFIAPKGPRWPGTGPNGKQWALSGDINICGCNPPPGFYAERGMKMSFTSQEAAALMGKDVSDATQETTTAAFDQHFILKNERTGHPLADMPYKIVTEDGFELEGRTDSQGRTSKISDDQAITATIQVFEETLPLNPDWDKHQ